MLCCSGQHSTVMIRRALVGTLALGTAVLVISMVYMYMYINPVDTDRVTDMRSPMKSTTIGHELFLHGEPAKGKQTGSSHHGNMTREITPHEGALQTSSSAPCEESLGILLLKTHKTGSSTLQNVLYRYGDARNLTFALPVVDVYMGCPQKFRPAFALRSPTGKFDILANHARFHLDNMRKVMRQGAKFVSILRYPPKQFESMYGFYRMERRYRVPLETFAESSQVLYNKYLEKHPQHSTLNPMLYDLGLDLDAMADDGRVAEWIDHLDGAFDLVLIAEHLAESLVLLKDLMCWEWEDVAFLPSNARTGSLVKSLSPRTEGQLRDWLRGDLSLYDHFNASLWARVRAYGEERMAADVARLGRLNQALKDRCIQGMRKVKELGGQTVIQRYVLRPEVARDVQCKRMTYSAVDYLTILRGKMKLKWAGRKGQHSPQAKFKVLVNDTYM